MAWLVRVVPLMLAGGAIGAWLAGKSFWFASLIAPLFGAVYLWGMRPLYVGLPLPLRFKPWLIKMRLLPQQ